MKAFSVMFVFACLLNSSWAEGLPVPDYQAKKITNNTYVIHGPREYPNEKNRGFMNNPGFVITRAPWAQCICSCQ